jgi:hypothetical protein
MKTLLVLVTTWIVIGLPHDVHAQSASKKLEQRKQTLTFEDELVEGTTTKPDLFYLFQKKNFNYKRLIKLRENFLPEMRRTSEEIIKKTE